MFKIMEKTKVNSCMVYNIWLFCMVYLYRKKKKKKNPPKH